MTTDRQRVILTVLEGSEESLGSSVLLDRLDGAVSAPTIKRDLSHLIDDGLVVVSGHGRATRYTVSPSFRYLKRIDVAGYFEREVDDRQAQTGFNWDLLEELPDVTLFSPEENDYLASLQRGFTERIATLSGAGLRKEQERFAVDLSWKSSQIEGNTYSLLETERLLREKRTADGKTQEEAIMLLNHKQAIDLVLEHPDYLAPLTLAGVEDIHRLLVQDLDVDFGVRSRRVGVTGTAYLPLDNSFQITDALKATCIIINDRESVFDKALLALALLSYIQSFMDGNKRTARIVSNALLLAGHSCPLSFRTVDSLYYKEAMLIFYEQNILSPVKQIFIEQFEFAVRTYF
ncbi:MAG: Fic family protein [Propionibacteriaceae bacterium]|nr:Fic family protein [Propionibacteriaceae bacterium]